MPKNGMLARLVLALAATLALAAVTAGVSSARTTSVTISGAGSSLVGPAVGLWANIWGGNTGNTVNYASVGSGTGEKDLDTRQVNFAGSDAPLSAYANTANPCSGCIQIPWALTATVPVYNIPGVGQGKLRLTGSVLASIYLGKITKWNAKPIKKLNPKLKLPNLTIAPVYRSDGSGDTFVFTSYLSASSPAWKNGPGAAPAINWPTGTGYLHNNGVATAVKSTSGAVGYVSASYVVNDHLKQASLKNSNGTWVIASLKTINAAAAVVKTVPSSGELSLINPKKNKSIKNAYPSATFTYLFLHKNGDLSAAGTAATVQFAKWVVHNGYKSVKSLMFAPLAKSVIAFDLKQLNSVTYSG